ncbi:helix-turn-helix transcriptional regulator [Pararhodobacter aggregans]|uniref:helix-turn-helix transcriptional regulator n=1 Tax=Pararhodobacter aggregans TaxID=404875 RepID=UPI003A920389
MARTDRLLRLLQAMRSMAPPITARRLAEETGVSLRSLYRDIDSLRAAGARIEGERGYGYRLTEDFALPPQSFSRDEIEAIALGMAEVRHMGEPMLAAAAASVLAKVAASLPDSGERHLVHAISQVYRPEARYGDMGPLDVIRQASWNEEALEIRYHALTGAVSRRRILPLAIVHSDRTMTVLAWCCLRADFRMFRADRIQSATPTDQSFRPRRVTLLRQYLVQLAEEDRTAPG